MVSGANLSTVCSAKIYYFKLLVDSGNVNIFLKYLTILK